LESCVIGELRLGTLIAKHLELLGKEFRLLVRDPKELSDFPEAKKVTGDYGDVESLDRAFSDVSSAFIVSGYAEPGEREIASQRVPGCAAGRRPLPDLSRDHYERRAVSEGSRCAVGSVYAGLAQLFWLL
jgi:uncharacterized protein YbjT (DUF2867 family)